MASDEVHSTLRRLHRFHEGVLGVGERVERTLFVVDPFTGRPVFPAIPGVLDEEHVTLHAPEDEPGAIVVLGRAQELDPLRDGACDRWLMYHGKARWGRWAAIVIESVKNAETVLDRDEAQVESPLVKDEPGICRWVNKERAEGLMRICTRALGKHPESALLVGVDPYGMDVRATFGVMRVEFEGIAETDGQVREVIEGMMR